MICKLCKTRQAAAFFGYCAACIKQHWDKVKNQVAAAHAASRTRFGLTPAIPKQGLKCGLCSNDCRIPHGGKGYCGLTENKAGKLIRLAGSPKKGLLNFYYDELPTNCVSAWTCAATGCAYPKYSISKKQEQGRNLAVFYGACSFDCAFCQNWEFKYLTAQLKPLYSAKKLAAAAKEDTRCICYFGGDPAPQLPHALATSQLLLKKAKEEKRIFRICLESNGTENPRLLKQLAKLVLESGGTIKFDLKFWDERLGLAISGVPNRHAYKNFELLSGLNAERPNPPLLTASTLLVPLYVDAGEVRAIAKFIASIDKNIPYSLLAFYPSFEMKDLPPTSRQQAIQCLSAAKAAGLKRVKIGNEHLLI